MSSAGSREFATISNILADRRAELHNARRSLLIRLMAAAPFQPATNLWRAIEMPELASVLPRFGRGLEIGCGDGSLTAILSELAEAKWELVGVDVDSPELARAEASGSYQRVHSRGLEKISEPNASFDFAFCNSVLQRVKSVRPVLVEAARCLRQSGLLAIAVPSTALYGQLSGGRSSRRETRMSYYADIDRRLGAVQVPTIDRWTNLLDAAGFELVELRGYMAGRQLRRWEKLSRRSRRPNRASDEDTGGEPSRRLSAQARGLTRSLRFLSHPAAWFAAYGVIDDQTDNVYEAGGWIIVAQRR